MDSPSKHGEAMKVARIGNRYPVESLAEGFAEGITTGHPGMPEFRFEPDEIDSLIAFLKSLE